MRFNSEIYMNNESYIAVNDGNRHIYYDTALRCLEDKCLDEIIEDPKMTILSYNCLPSIRCAIWVENNEWYPIIKFAEDQKYSLIDGDWIFDEKFESHPHEKEYVEKQLEACKQLATIVENIISSRSGIEKYIRMAKIDDIIVKSSKYQLPKCINPNKFGYLNDTRILVLDDKGCTIEKLNLPVSFTIEFPERLIGKKVAIVSYRIIPEKNQLS